MKIVHNTVLAWVWVCGVVTFGHCSSSLQEKEQGKYMKTMCSSEGKRSLRSLMLQQSHVLKRRWMLLHTGLLPQCYRDVEAVLRARLCSIKVPTWKRELNRFCAPTKQVHRKAAAVVVQVGSWQVSAPHVALNFEEKNILRFRMTWTGPGDSRIYFFIIFGLN